ncbi:PREDICTED: uncharacterized protein LOC105620352, partial [Atta cephalotes]|uniref:Uncharacterized protein n=1 Tax=Atta cephalotes TaxID=12957 RepID=A0A158NI85_ATTCE
IAAERLRDLSQRIINGEHTELDEFPWMILLKYQQHNKRYIFIVVYCIKDLSVNWRLSSVRLGEYDIDTDRNCMPDSTSSLFNSSLDDKLFMDGWRNTVTRSTSNIKLKLALPLTDKNLRDETYVCDDWANDCNQKGQDWYQGDSDSPLISVEEITDNTRKWTAVGVESFGSCNRIALQHIKII